MIQPNLADVAGHTPGLRSLLRRPLTVAVFLKTAHLEAWKSFIAAYRATHMLPTEGYGTLF